MARLKIIKDWGKKEPVEVTFEVFQDLKTQTRGAEISQEELAKALAKKMGSPVSLMTKASLLKAIQEGLDEVVTEMKSEVKKVL